MFSSVAWAEQDSLSVAVTRSHSVNACRLYNVEHLAQFGASLIVAQMLPGLLNDFCLVHAKAFRKWIYHSFISFPLKQGSEKKIFFSIVVSYSGKSTGVKAA